jgi:uracil permease
MNNVRYGVLDKPPLKELIPLGIQMMLSCFGATILVPMLTGLQIGPALFGAGIGTLLFILMSKKKAALYLGSSFAFIAPLAFAGQYGIEYVAGGCVVSGLLYMIIAGIISKVGNEWLNKALPPIVVGNVIAVIGLSLSATAVSQASTLNGEYSLVALSIAAVSLGVMIIANNFCKGFVSLMPVAAGMIGGYLFTLIMGWVFPAYHIIDFTSVKEAAWITLPHFVVPKFNLTIVLIFLLTSFSTVVEHCGDMKTLSKVTGVDVYEEIGLHRTLFADGLSSAVSGLFGAPCTTSYGESLSTMALTKVTSIWVLGAAAVFAIVSSFFGKFTALIGTIPAPVIGGCCMLLYGTIASSGIRNIVDSGLDYTNKKNLVISSVILVTGIGGLALNFTINSNIDFSLSSVALATVIGIVLNAVLPDEDN